MSIADSISLLEVEVEAGLGGLAPGELGGGGDSYWESGGGEAVSNISSDLLPARAAAHPPLGERRTSGRVVEESFLLSLVFGGFEPPEAAHRCDLLIVVGSAAWWYACWLFVRRVGMRRCACLLCFGEVANF